MQIDNNFLDNLGLAELPEEEKQQMIQDILRVLAARVGERAEQALDEAKQEEFAKLLETADQPSTINWLANNLPSYQSIVTEEIERVREEIRPQVPGILADLASESAEAQQDS